MDNTNRKPAILHGLPNAPQNCYQRLLPKAISQSYVPKVVSKGVIESCSPHNCAPQLLQKVVRKAVPESCFRNLFSKGPWSCARAALQSPKAGSQKCSQKIPQSYSSKLLLKINKIYFPKFLENMWPKVVVLQSKCSLKLFRKAVQSFPEAAPQSCSPKLLPQNCDSSPNGSPKPFCKAVPCSPKVSVKLPPKAAPQNCGTKLNAENYGFPLKSK